MKAISGYMVAPLAGKLCSLDGRDLYAGIPKGSGQRRLLRQHYTDPGKPVKGYLISHPHLDHGSLIIKFTGRHGQDHLRMSYTLKVLEEKFFTWSRWAILPTREKPYEKNITMPCWRPEGGRRSPAPACR